MQPNMRPSFSQRLYPYRRPLTWLFHGCLVLLAYLGAYELRFEFAIPPVELRRFLTTLPLLVVLRPASFYVFGLFRDYWRHVSLRDLANVILAVTLGSVAFVGLLYVTGHFRGMSRAVLVLDWLLAIFLVGGFRFGTRIAGEVQVLRRLKAPQGKRTFIIGAGEAGEQLLRQLLHEPRRRLRVVGLIDDDPNTHGRSLHGVRVLGGTAALPQLTAAHRVQLLVIAVPSATRAELRRIVERCVEAQLPFQILPRLGDLLAQRAEIGQLRDVQLEDLLGREPVAIRLDEVERDLAGKTILITGGGGSIGSELARKVARFRPRRIVLLDRAENTLYFAALELHRAHPDIELLPVIANITNPERVGEVFRTYQPTYVYHAAAYKHVPLCEANPSEAAWNNIVGTLRLAEAAARYGVAKFVLISTDKAVNPTSVLGATKRVAERVVLELPYLALAGTDFRAVRFGNVLGSDGSVLPLFRQQLAAGGPLTVTHPEVKRYFMTIPEAAELVLQAAALPEARGRIAMLEMGEQVRIVDLAEHLIRLSGLVPHRDIRIEFTGLRPGEKLHEELVAAGETAHPTSIGKIFVIRPKSHDPLAFRLGLDRLAAVLLRGDDDGVLRGIGALVPEYNPWPGSAAARAVAAARRDVRPPVTCHVARRRRHTRHRSGRPTW
jgi:FlaA1/EpsC-like NDP-sugar epimerase